MLLVHNIFFAVLITNVIGRLIVTHDQIETEVFDHNLIPFAHGEMFRFNETTSAANLTFQIGEVQRDYKVTVSAQKLINGKYIFGNFHVTDTIEHFINSYPFETDHLFEQVCRPPMRWPLEIHVTYRCSGWIPSYSIYPQSMPSGKWKINSVVSQRNKTPILAINWYLTTSHRR